MRCEKFGLEIRTVELKKNFGAPPLKITLRATHTHFQQNIRAPLFTKPAPKAVPLPSHNVIKREIEEVSQVIFNVAKQELTFLYNRVKDQWRIIKYPMSAIISRE